MKKIIIVCLALVTAGHLTAQQADTTLKQYTGRFVFAEGSVVPEVSVTWDNGMLNMSSSAGTSSLSKLGVDSFWIDEFSGTAVFRKENGKVKSVHIEAGGYVLDGKKDEGGGISFIPYRKPAPAKLPEGIME